MKKDATYWTEKYYRKEREVLKLKQRIRTLESEAGEKKMDSKEIIIRTQEKQIEEMKFELRRKLALKDKEIKNWQKLYLNKPSKGKGITGMSAQECYERYL